MQRHKRERNGKWVHNDYLLSAIEDNALLDWITKPVKLKGRKQDWSNVGLPQQEAFKDFMDHCPAEDAVEVLQKYNIVRVQALRDFVWPVHTRDYEAARHRNGDRYVQVKDRHIGYIWAFDAGGVFHGDIIDRLIEMHPEDEDLARAAEASRHNGKAKPAGERRGRPKGTNNRTSLTGAADSNVGREASPNPPTPGLTPYHPDTKHTDNVQAVAVSSRRMSRMLDLLIDGMPITPGCRHAFADIG